MTFNIAEFVKTNKVFVIWTAFAALLYLFRDMFGLVFITYIMCFITYSLTQWLENSLGMRRRLAVLLIYLVFLVIIGGFLFFLTPSLVSEARGFTEQLPGAMRLVEAWVDANSAENSIMVTALERVKEFLTPEQMVLQGWAMGRGLLEKSLHYVSWFFLALMFSFLIMMDLPHLVQGVKALRNTRLASAYEETADSVVLFAKVVGENFRAQLMISAVNTVLTAIGLYLLGIKGMVLLCTLVFFCGLIPVLGVFISSVPIFLMAVNSGGIMLGVWGMLMVVVIHMIEAYVLNPRIVSAVMSINPVMTLIILYLAHSLIGIWGMLLGVPIAVYIYRQLVMEQKQKAASGEDTEPAPVDGAKDGGGASKE